MLNFPEQTGSGAVTVVWTFLSVFVNFKYINYYHCESCYSIRPTVRSCILLPLLALSIKLLKNLKSLDVFTTKLWTKPKLSNYS